VLVGALAEQKAANSEAADENGEHCRGRGGGCAEDQPEFPRPDDLVN
jgi:hypothetical protein